MASEQNKKATEKLLAEYLELVRNGGENRGLCFAIVTWFPDPLSEETIYQTDWNGENFAARGAAQELLREIRATVSHNGKTDENGAK